MRRAPATRVSMAQDPLLEPACMLHTERRGENELDDSQVCKPSRQGRVAREAVHAMTPEVRRPEGTSGPSEFITVARSQPTVLAEAGSSWSS